MAGGARKIEKYPIRKYVNFKNFMPTSVKLGKTVYFHYTLFPTKPEINRSRCCQGKTFSKKLIEVILIC